MEVVDSHTSLNAGTDDDRTTVAEDFTADVDRDVCHKPNGVNCVVINEVSDDLACDKNNISEMVVTTDAETTQECEVLESSDVKTEVNKTVPLLDQQKSNDIHKSEKEKPEMIQKEDIHKLDDNVSSSKVNVLPNITPSSKPSENTTELSDKIEDMDSSIVPDVSPKENTSVPESSVILQSTEPTTLDEEVHFETEVLIEENGNDLDENAADSSHINEEVKSSANNILGELGQNIELSEVLTSSDVIIDNSENNNSEKNVEVFNKEELLDILEGKNVEQSSPKFKPDELTEIVNKKALEQISMLKKIRKRRTTQKELMKIIDVKTSLIKKKETDQKSKQKRNEMDAKGNATSKNSIDADNLHEKEKVVVPEQRQEEKSIVTALVMDWDDDEADTNDKTHVTTDKLVKDINKDVAKKEQNTQESTVRPSVDSSMEDESATHVKSEDEGPPRRLGRVIKKKVIFDPDNPDTFTKSKTISKSRDQYIIKEHPTKKVKPELLQQRTKSKSPTSKLQWKKPSPRNSKQNKRLSEVDKLLMDEGAVNMIYQLTPEAPKGKKNVKTKAEFIKKLQSSTPEGKEMKFRERKKEIKLEDGEARRILSGKQRTSLSSSVMSPSVSEDFENQSADDSIIYRRHSSSSYSSSCMSPRRLSDVDASMIQQNVKTAHVTDSSKNTMAEDNQKKSKVDKQFNTSANENVITDIINKEECRSIKEKLNSRLSQALNKRKRESIKSDKPPKQKKKSLSVEDLNNSESNELKFVSIKTENRLAEVSIQKAGMKNCIETLKELEKALKQIDADPEIAVTLLSCQCGTLCSSIDMSVLLEENKEVRRNNAHDLANSVSSLMGAVSRHSKLVCAGVEGACYGPALGVVALCDVVLASEGATFSMSPTKLVLPGAAALTAPRSALPQQLVNDLVLFGRSISASEALAAGLISRMLWPDRVDEQARTIVRDIAQQTTQSILLKKRLINLNKSKATEETFQTSLESERDLLVEYWTSVEGLELLRAAVVDSA
ncbi:unnamed protein product [Leptidea sinapis]|uniref:Uncharacterized protein n=1 Tax=Leptidea sinapis TaxID=189913 RepID=A0A5E4PNN3_9NEOP|nr:unnamed protein product [Leptidea sinapis]